MSEEVAPLEEFATAREVRRVRLALGRYQRLTADQLTAITKRLDAYNGNIEAAKRIEARLADMDLDGHVEAVRKLDEIITGDRLETLVKLATREARTAIMWEEIRSHLSPFRRGGAILWGSLGGIVAAVKLYLDNT